MFHLEQRAKREDLLITLTYAMHYLKQQTDKINQ
jgi:hypothetical protein